jgi:hypothetical protein
MKVWEGSVALYVHRSSRAARSAPQGPGIMRVGYGEPLGGIPAHTVILVDPPVCAAEREWLDTGPLCRLTPGGTFAIAQAPDPFTFPTPKETQP